MTRIVKPPPGGPPQGPGSSDTPRTRAEAIQDFNDALSAGAAWDPAQLSAALRQLLDSLDPLDFEAGSRAKDFEFPKNATQRPEILAALTFARETATWAARSIRAFGEISPDAVGALDASLNALAVAAAKVGFREELEGLSGRERALPRETVSLVQERLRTDQYDWTPEVDDPSHVYHSFAGAEQTAALIDTAMGRHRPDRSGLSTRVLGERVQMADRRGRTLAAIELLEHEAPRDRPVTDAAKLHRIFESFINRCRARGEPPLELYRDSGRHLDAPALETAQTRLWQAVDRYTREVALDHLGYGTLSEESDALEQNVAWLARETFG